MIDDALRLTIDDLFDTKSSCIDEKNQYFSPYKVENYSDSEIMYDFVVDLNK